MCSRFGAYADPIGSTPADTYLRNRRVGGELPLSLRYHPGFRHASMVAAVQAPDRSISGLHRTCLRCDASDKRPVSGPVMLVGQIARGAVRLAAAGPERAIGEGPRSGWRR